MKNRDQFNQKVSEITGISVAELQQDTVDEIIVTVILPKIALIGGSQNRCSRISSTYMDFIAEYGGFIHTEAKQELSGLLFELGLQRLSNGALLHEPVNLVKILPDQFKIYSAGCDEPGIFSKACWNFFKRNLAIMYRNIPYAYMEHTRKIVFGIMEHVKDDGTTDLPWDEKVAGITALELRLFVESYAKHYCSEEERWRYVTRVKTNRAFLWVHACNAGSVPLYQLTAALAPVWQRNKAFFRTYFNQIDWGMFKNYVEFENENEKFFSGGVRKVLKFFGLYKILTMYMIKKEIKKYKIEY
ncbi:MAG: hypothetical protein IKW39_00155 [Alphaproteobacteria bacterium]|nr:hypothetical protein [Alphaproteobacteria bacterium]